VVKIVYKPKLSLDQYMLLVVADMLSWCDSITRDPFQEATHSWHTTTELRKKLRYKGSTASLYRLLKGLEQMKALRGEYIRGEKRRGNKVIIFKERRYKLTRKGMDLVLQTEKFYREFRTVARNL
jgi:hypothetical protein